MVLGQLVRLLAGCLSCPHIKLKVALVLEGLSFLSQDATIASQQSFLAKISADERFHNRNELTEQSGDVSTMIFLW